MTVLSRSTWFKIVGVTIGIGLLCILVLFAPLTFPPSLTEPEPVGVFPHKPIWVFQAAEQIITAPVVKDRWIIVRTSKGVYWLDVKGVPLQRVEISGFTCLNCFNRAPIVCEEWLLVPEGKRALSAFTLSTGALVWTAVPRSRTGLYYYTPSDVPVESIACGKGIAYVARFNWSLTAYKLLDGTVLWESSAPGRSSLSLATDGRIVYLGGYTYIRAYDGFSGELLWSKNLGAFVQAVQLVGETLYIGLFKAPFLAINVDSRTLRWQVDVPAGEYPFLIDGDTLYITNQGHLIAISREDGQVLWQKEWPGANLGSPIVANGVLYVRSTHGYLYALEASTGREVGGLRVQPDGPFVFASDRGPAVAGDLLLVPFGDNRLLAYPLINLEMPERSKK